MIADEAEEAVVRTDKKMVLELQEDECVIAVPGCVHTDEMNGAFWKVAKH